MVISIFLYFLPLGKGSNLTSWICPVIAPKAIPENVDVLLVHGPPLGRGDALLPSLKRRGCMEPGNKVEIIESVVMVR